MNNKFYEIPNDWYSEFNNNYMMSMPNNSLSPEDVALDRGNLFNNLYNPYRNYKYRNLKPNNKKEELLLNILRHNFALTELDLYLDLNPMDRNMISLYNRYLDNKKQLVMDYENNFGPLTLAGSNVASNDWHWGNSPWPWEGTK